MSEIISDLDYWTGIKSQNYWYNVIQRIGSGGSSYTYQCIRSIQQADRDEFAEGAGNTYVIKLFTAKSKDERERRFNEERDFLKKTEHPSILNVHDSGEYDPEFTDEAYPFYVSDYMPVDMQDLIERDKSTPIPKKVSYAVQLLSALVYLENNDPPIIHRDIKPGNIFFSADSCVLADFGAMREGKASAGVDKDSEDEVMPTYSSIDMFLYEKEGRPITDKSNVFQLGIVLAELFTGRVPTSIPGETYEVDQIDDLKLPNSYPDDVGDRISDEINKMLTKDPSERPTAGDIIEEWRWILKDCTKNQEYKIK